MDGSTTDGEARLARFLRTLRLRSTFTCDAALTAPWALEMPGTVDSLSFHVITAGTAWIRIGGAAPVELRAGDLALVPHGRGHELLADPAAAGAHAAHPRVDELPQEYLTEHYSVLEYGGGGRASRLICGIVRFDDPTAREFARSLPEIVVISGEEESAASAIRDTLRLMASEQTAPALGSEAVATRLAEILVVQAIRAWVAGAGADAGGWVRAIRDARIGPVLAAIHERPGDAWTLESFSRLASMSRSAFSARFLDLTGASPIAYLAGWRMSVARARLADGSGTAASLARQLGYASEPAFHRAFVRIVGETPGRYAERARRSSSAAAEQLRDGGDHGE
ncbi:AraC family transcriptional regulator [Leucobacter sp. CSA2]|uniref:AraC family transcriptional regulator n=1 Tax=Leucobacter edaphi TaxID=2796472 RepID=A0A934QDC9_9MICO|nr:AraC family transcriptional regulator [Leucobacter edaphi]MBK0422143.1 AraC family transcriptional regulator [Leucobacter edaphi]